MLEVRVVFRHNPNKTCNHVSLKASVWEPVKDFTVLVPTTDSVPKPVLVGTKIEKIIVARKSSQI